MLAVHVIRLEIQAFNLFKHNILCYVQIDCLVTDSNVVVKKVQGPKET